MTATAPAHAPSSAITGRGRHGVAAITAPMRITVSSLFVSSRPAPGASLHSSESAFHSAQQASSTSGSVAGERANVPGGRAIASVSRSPAASSPPGYQAVAK